MLNTQSVVKRLNEEGVCCKTLESLLALRIALRQKEINRLACQAGWDWERLIGRLS